MARHTVGCLIELGCLAAVIAVGVQCCDDKDDIGYKNKNIPATLIKTTTVGNYTYYFIDTDTDLKTAEYTLITKVGSHDDMQLRAKSLNHSDEKPLQLPLNIWRKHSESFLRIRN